MDKAIHDWEFEVGLLPFEELRWWFSIELVSADDEGSHCFCLGPLHGTLYAVSSCNWDRTTGRPARALTMRAAVRAIWHWLDEYAQISRARFAA